MSQGKAFRKAIKDNKPLQIVGTINAYSSLLAKKSGHKAIYLSGGGVAASSLGVPDLGITTLNLNVFSSSVLSSAILLM